MPAPTQSSDTPPPEMHVQDPSNRLVLCFDGTGNKFQGTPGDTNIVKLYNMLDRTNSSQMHYYQPGIGTYPVEGPVNVSWWQTFKRKVEAVLDSGLATSFDTHVIAGYKFIMRYYKPGDRIYIFGFSRGAFTARFLARMISHVGLLSMGNEELVPFAYKVYQEYEQNRSGSADAQAKQVKYMNAFKKHFCRTERQVDGKDKENITANESGIKVHFLGLFDCVSSVGNLDIPFFAKTPPLPPVQRTAEHIRHAVAIDERRVKFKAALFSQEKDEKLENIKEVWFPGNHGDIGGGWDVENKEDGTPHESTDDDYFQLSDIALKWMIDEIDDVELSRKDSTERLAWDSAEKASFLKRFDRNKKQMISARMHDTLAFNGGSSISTTIMWKLMEALPFFIKRWEYVESPKRSGNYIWDYVKWPLNLGGRRDIPAGALFHHSVIDRMRLSPDKKNFRPKLYAPNNSLWVPASSGSGVKERNLKELADEYTPKPANGHGGESQLPVNDRIHFVYNEDMTTGSVPIDGLDDELVGAAKWDRVYTVAPGR